MPIDFHQDGNWHAHASECIATDAAGTLTWSGRPTSAVALKFYASQAAGKVRVLWDGQERLLDLYAPADPASPKTVLLELSPAPDYWTPLRTLRLPLRGPGHGISHDGHLSLVGQPQDGRGRK